MNDIYLCRKRFCAKKRFTSDKEHSQRPIVSVRVSESFTQTFCLFNTELIMYELNAATVCW